MDNFDEWTEWVETARLTVPDDITDLEYVQVKWNDGSITDLGFHSLKNHGWRQNCAANGYIVAYRVRNKSSEWNGTGLPPVGCECEWSDAGHREFCKATVMGRFGVRVWLMLGDLESGTPVTVYDPDAANFRPIRTEAEKQREADKEALRQIVFENDSSDSILEAILGAGFTRKPDEQKPQ